MNMRKDTIPMKSRLKKIEKQVVGKSLKAEKIRQIFQKEFEDLGVEVTTHPYGDEIGENQITSNGYFEASEWDLEFLDHPVDLVNIELMLIIHSKNKPICINNTDWQFLAHQVEQTIEHEMIHREQSKKRFCNIGGESYPIYDDHLSEEDKRIHYLSDPDEIDAYSNMSLIHI